MKEEWLFPNAFVPVDVETTSALVVEIKRLIDVVGGMALAQPAQEPVAWLDEERKIIYWHNTHETDDYHGFKRSTPLYTSPPAAQPAQEPVAWLTKDKFSNKVDLDAKNAKETTGWSAAFPVYTAPQQRPWVGLTDEDQFNLVHAMNKNDWHAIQMMDAIEAKLKEKNT